MVSEEIESYLKAGEIGKKIKEFVPTILKEGMKLIDLAELIEGKIKEFGATPAFPVNLSIDEIAAHYTPRPGDENLAKGLLKIDIGVCVKGYIADFAICFDLTEDNEHKEIIELNKKILEAATKTVNKNLLVRDVGNITEKTLKEYNEANDTSFNLIHELCGHGLGKNIIHDGLIIPNYQNGNETKVEGGFAIEPFVTYGIGRIYEGAGGGIYNLSSDSGIVRDKDVREILGFLKKNYLTRPFCARWLVNENFKKINFALRMLEKQGIIREYPLLIEKTKKPVSQVENTFIIFDDLVECTTN